MSRHLREVEPPPPEPERRDWRSAVGRVQLPPQSFGLLVGFTLGVVLGALTDALTGLLSVAAIWALCWLVARWL